MCWSKCKFKWNRNENQNIDRNENRVSIQLQNAKIWYTNIKIQSKYISNTKIKKFCFINR